MSARAALPTFTIVVLLLACATGLAAAGPWNLAPGEYSSGFRASFFSADTYHDQNGDRALLFNGGLEEERTATSFSELGWKKHLDFILGIPWSSETRRLSDHLTNPPTTTGLGDAIVGVRYGLLQGTAAAALEIDWKAPLGYERRGFLTHRDSVLAGDTNGDGDSLDMNRVRQLGDPRLGDGQQDITVVLDVGTALPAFRGFVQASGGYKYRFETPQDQIVGSADVGFWAMRHLLVAGHYEGFVPVKDGERPTDEPQAHRVGPRLLYRVDNGIDLLAGSLHTMAAKNALHTDEYFVGVSFRLTKLGPSQGYLGASP